MEEFLWRAPHKIMQVGHFPEGVCNHEGQYVKQSTRFVCNALHHGVLPAKFSGNFCVFFMCFCRFRPQVTLGRPARACVILT